jgi:hypothetical protein
MCGFVWVWLLGGFVRTYDEKDFLTIGILCSGLPVEWYLRLGEKQVPVQAID